MAMIFLSKLDIKSMISTLREKIPSIDWRMGDSHYEGFYVKGHTKDGIKLKITEDDGPGKYYLGIYFYGTDHAIGAVRKLLVILVLQRKIMRAIGDKKRDRRLRLPWKG